MKKLPILQVFFLVAVFLSGPLPTQGEDVTAVPGGAAPISPAELAENLKSKDFFLVNVAPSYAGEIPQTDAFIRFDETLGRLSEYPSDKAAKIVVYCLTGKTSAIALDSLRTAGFVNARMLQGGIRAWEQAGLTVLHRNSAPSSPYPAASKDVSAPVPQPCPCGLD